MEPDPELCYCDHKDRNKLNNDVSNLEWASGSLNAKNCKNRGEYVTTLPEGAVEFVEYKSYKFADYFIHKCDDVK